MLNLAHMVRRAQPHRRKNVALRAISPTRVLEHKLASIYKQVLDLWMAELRSRILPTYEASLYAKQAPGGNTPFTRIPGGVRVDSSVAVVDTANSIDQAIEVSMGAVDRLLISLTPDLRSWVLATERWHRAQLIQATKTATTVDLGTMIGSEGAQEAMASVLSRNTDLISNVSQATKTKISQSIWSGFQSRTPRDDVASNIEESVGLEYDRALRIASDQTTKLAAALDQERQQELGIDRFIWRHSHKKHFRPWHKDRDGQIFAWDDPDLQDDLPGMEPFCGCKAQAYIDIGGSDG